MSVSIGIADYWAFCFSITPFSSMDSEVNTVDEIEGTLTSFDKNLSGTGGLNRVNFGNSFKIFKGLSAGFNASYLFGNITKMEKALTNDSFSGYELKDEQRAGGFYIDYGLQYSIKMHDWFHTLGLIYGNRKVMNTTDASDFTYNDETRILEPADHPDVQIPQKIGLGISVQNSRFFRAGFDYEFNNWSALEYDGKNFSVNNSHRFSIGLEYAPRFNEDSAWQNT